MRSPAFAGLVALAAVACGTEPVELAPSYDLTTVEGGAPPRLVGATVECDVSIVGGRVTFGTFGPHEDPAPEDYFELGLDVLMDCSRGGGSNTESTYGYTGTAEVDHRLIRFHTARLSGPLVFEGVLSVTGELETVVPLLVPVADEVSVEFAPN
jgi:hypothetical protein